MADLPDRLKLGLSEKPREGSTPTAELAEQIQALRASVRVEAAPERTGTRKAVRAERPVTARIRERLGEQPVTAAEREETAPGAVEEKPKPEQPPASPPPAVIAKPDLGKPDYREIVTRRKQGNEAQLRLF